MVCIQRMRSVAGGAMMVLLAATLSFASCGDADYGVLNPSTSQLTADGRPGTVSDLFLHWDGGNGVTLMFTEVDDGKGGRALYDVRASSARPIDYEAAPQTRLGTCRYPLQGRGAGTRVRCTVRGLNSSLEYEFQVRAIRIEATGEAVAGALSNVVGTAPVVSPPPDSPPPPQPIAVPGRVADLAAPLADAQSVALRFTGVNDGTGAPATYEMRFRSPTMDWSSAAVVTQGTCSAPIQGVGVGEIRTCTATGLESGTPYEFQMVAYRAETDSIVRGALSNVAAATTTAVDTPPAPPPATPPAGVLFRSDWRTATGTSQDALRDVSQQRPWDVTQSNGAAVIASTGLDFPTTNVLDARVLYSGSFARANIIRYTGLGETQIGERRSYRFYLRVTTPNAYDLLSGADSRTHPMQDGNAASDSNWMLQVFTNANGTWNMRLAFSSGSANAYPNQFFTPGTLRKHETYRIELQVHRISSTQYNMHARVYDSAGTLVADDDDFANANGSATLASNPALNFNNVASTTGLNAGHNGVASSVGGHLFPFTLYYEGGFAVCSGGWCGPYNAGT